MRISPAVIVVVLCCAVGTSCSGDGEKKNETEKGMRLSGEMLKEVRLLFAHRSVGAIILNVIEKYGDCISVSKELPPRKSGDGLFIRSFPVGKNGDPISKFRAFEKQLLDEEGGRYSAAMMKLCYADIGRKTDVNSVFREYAKTCETLSKSFPKLRIVHCTVPLTEERTGIVQRLKVIVKKVLGKPYSEVYDDVYDNIQRNRYNRLIRDKFQGTNIFDIAFIEAKRPAGGVFVSSKGGEKHESMYPGKSHDGGHPAEKAAVELAVELLRVLASE